MSSQPSSLLRHRPFLAFWLARVCTASGFQMLTVAIGWHIYELTGNVLDLGLVGLVEFLPRVLFMLHTGHVADRYDRRRIAALCQTGQALVAVALVLGAASGEITRNMIFVLAFALGTARAFEMPTTQALLPNLVPAGLFPRAVAASASAMQAATIAAPALGGLLYAFGASWVYVPTATLYVLACVLTLSLPVRNQPLTQGKATLDSLLAGIRFIRSRPDIFGAISLDLFAVLLGGATALLPVFAKDILLTGPWGLGRCARLQRWAPWRCRSGWRTSASNATSGGSCSSPWASSAWQPSPSACRNRSGCPSACWWYSAPRTWSAWSSAAPSCARDPDEMRGRVSAVNGLFIGASNQLGEFESGLTAHWFGTVPAVVLGGSAPWWSPEHG